MQLLGKILISFLSFWSKNFLKFFRSKKINAQIKEVKESCDGFISFDKLSDNDVNNKPSLLFALRIIKDFFMNSKSNEEIKSKSNRFSKIKSNPEIIKSVSSFSTLTNL